MPQVGKSNMIEKFLRNDLIKFTEDVKLNERKEKIINDLPDEVFFNKIVMTYLDMK